MSRYVWRVARNVSRDPVNLTWPFHVPPGTISSSRCQITRASKRPVDGTQSWREFNFHGRAFQARSKFIDNHRWWSQTGSNRRPPACKAGALPTELWPRLRLACQPKLADTSPGFALRAPPGNLHLLRKRRLVGLGRFELPTSRLSSARSNQLSYKPVPGVSDQKPVIRRHKSHLITEY